MFKINSKQINNFIKTHKIPLIIGGIAALLIIGGTIAYLALTPKETPKQDPEVVTPEPEKPIIFYSELTGRPVATEEEILAPTTCIMIENSPDARPQSGLRDAGTVYEAIAEGGITRFLTVFQDRKPELIGPVRSLRMYYLDWLTPYDCSIAHVGGSDEALKAVRNPANGYHDIDQFFNADFYWRSKDRAAPHNVYTSFEKLDALNAKKGHTVSNFTSFTRRAEAKTFDPTYHCPEDETCSSVMPSPISNINIKISSNLYNPHYKYNQETNTYDRYHQYNTTPHMVKYSDGTTAQISPDVVIAMMVNETSSTTEPGREAIETLGSGKAYVFQAGDVTVGTWKRPTKSEVPKFYDENNKEIILNPGQVWLSAVPNHSGTVTYE